MRAPHASPSTFRPLEKSLRRVLLTLSIGLLVIVIGHEQPVEGRANPTNHPMMNVLMGALWYGNAHLEPVRDVTIAGWTEGGPAIVTRNGYWYLFTKQGNGPPASQCIGGDWSRIVVRVSVDQGASWSGPYVAAEPMAGYYTQCAVADGHAFYESETNTWHLLAQCRGTEEWAMCHYTRQGDPLGQFTPDPLNPVIHPGQLWSQLCGTQDSHCASSTIDEGTPEIIYKYGGDYYVTFHGFHYSEPSDPSDWLYRGVAKTADFQNWITWDQPYRDTANGALPFDSMFGPEDCQSWQPGCIGGGEATMMSTFDWHYMLIETPRSFGGTPEEQNWGFQLVRSQNLPRSGPGDLGSTWEQYPGGGWFLPPTSVWGDPQYARFFSDGDQAWLAYQRTDNHIHFSRIVLNGPPPVFPAVTLKTENGHYVTSAQGGGFNVTVTQDQVMGWNVMAIFDLTNAQLTDGDQIQIQVDSGHFVAAECGGGQGCGGGVVNANRTSAGPWETFTIIKVGGSGGSVIRDGDQIALQSWGGYYCTADVNGGGPGSFMTCNRTWIANWETFTLSIASFAGF